MQAAILLTWIRRDLFAFSNDDNIEVMENGIDGVRVRVYTDTNSYTLTSKATPPSGYLGCTSKSRKPRAGEEWSRGNDLADGPLTEETWNDIKNDIISYELVVLAKHKKRPLIQTG